MLASDAVEKAPYIHATAFVVEEWGILVRGASGAGKSCFAESVMISARQRGHFAALVGDDRIMLEQRASRLLMRPHPALYGLIERRGLGIMPIASIAAARLTGVVDLTLEPMTRLPAPEEQCIALLGQNLPRLTLAKTCMGESQLALFWAWFAKIRQDARSSA